jgi:phage baseplate assembly protein W
MIYSDLNLFMRDETSVNFRASPTAPSRRVKALVSKNPILIQDVNSIKQSIITILYTTKGSRVFLPEFGCSLVQYLYNPIDLITSRNIENEISSAIFYWENRVIITSLEVQPDPENQQYYVSMEYDIPTLTYADGVAFNLRTYS